MLDLKQGEVIMKRERLIALSIIVFFMCGFTAVLSGVARSQATIHLNYANFPPEGTFPCVQMERWAKEVEKRTTGKVKVHTFPGGTLVSAKNMFDGVQSGITDIGNFAMSYQPGRFLVSEAISLPVGFPSSKVASMALYDLLEKYNPKEFESVKILAAFTSPPSSFMTKTPVRTLKDLKGMEVRVSGTLADAVQALGATPVAMPQSDTPEAIQKGVVKGIVSSIEVLKDFNFAAYCPYTTIVNIALTDFTVVMNKTKWNSLPPDVKKILDDLKREQSEWTAKYVDDHVTEAVAWSKQKYNHQVLQLPASDKAEIPKLMKPIIDEYIKRAKSEGLPSAEIVKDVYALKAKYEKVYKE
jgi:TRAP-type C4-dicarboxylate transport system substrate-binding protein